MEDRLTAISKKVIRFRDERDWKQFHDPKNLSEAICIESGELLEKFLWKTSDQSRTPDKALVHDVKEEVADVMIFLIYLCDTLNIDLLAAVENKLKSNQEKYPKEKARGTSKKYTEL
ncbi:nucleotide pyrophosphohydrolase [Chloroflexota bacterium]